VGETKHIVIISRYINPIDNPKPHGIKLQLKNQTKICVKTVIN